MIKGLCAGVFEMQQRVRGMTNAMMDPFLFPDFSDKLIGKIADLKIEFWEMALTELTDFVEIGIDILNPVHITAAGMEPGHLKKDFVTISSSGGVVSILKGYFLTHLLPRFRVM